MPSSCRFLQLFLLALVPLLLSSSFLSNMFCYILFILLYASIVYHTLFISYSLPLPLRRPLFVLLLLLLLIPSSASSFLSLWRPRCSVAAPFAVRLLCGWPALQPHSRSNSIFEALLCGMAKRPSPKLGAPKARCLFEAPKPQNRLKRNAWS